MATRVGILFVMGCFLTACGQKEDRPITGVGGVGKGDGPNIVVTVSTEAAFRALVQVTNQTNDTVFGELCRRAWWERKIVEPPTEEGGEETVRWEAAGPPMDCGDYLWWEYFEPGERQPASVELPSDADGAPVPSTYRLAVDILADLDSSAASLGIIRSNEVVVADMTTECDAMCAKVDTCSGNGDFDALACSTWCSSMLSAAIEPVVRACASCFEEQACNDILVDPADPFDISGGNPGACMVDCRVGECETNDDCGDGQACQYDIDWNSSIYAYKWACFEVVIP